MQLHILLISIVILCITARDIPDGYKHVPGGWLMHESCIFEAPNDVLDRDLMENTEPCPFPALRRADIYGMPEAQVYAMSTSSTMPTGTGPNAQSMITNWNVPDLPKYRGYQVVYFWPGFKSQQPVMGYPVLQPVLQYGQQGRQWYLQSWFVWGNRGVVYTGQPIPVKVGDTIDSYMVLEGNGNWKCYANITSTGASSVLTVAPSQVDNTQYQYAMLVLETIMPSVDCSYYPKGGDTGVTFTDVSVNGKAVKWTDSVVMTECNQKINDQSTTVQFTWSN